MKMPKGKDETEWAVKQEIKKVLETMGWKYRMPSAGAPFGAIGTSDFLCFKSPKLFMAIEAKYEDVVTTPQFNFLKDVHETGHYAVLVDETNVDKLLGWLQKVPDILAPYVPKIFLKWQDQDPLKRIKISQDT